MARSGNPSTDPSDKNLVHPYAALSVAAPALGIPLEGFLDKAVMPVTSAASSLGRAMETGGAAVAGGATTA